MWEKIIPDIGINSVGSMANLDIEIKQVLIA